MSIHKMRGFGLLLISAVSSCGDVLFLTGVPLFLYKQSGGHLVHTTFVTLAITFTIFLLKRRIQATNEKHPLLAVGVGELKMAATELALLALYLATANYWLVVLGAVPLAAIYNSYSPSKRFKLQEYFFEDELFYWTSLQSTFDRFGRLAGVALSGYVVETSGLSAILLVDAATFVAFGATCLYLKHRLGRRYGTMAHAQTKGAAPTASVPLQSSHFRSATGLDVTAVACIASNLLLNWEQISSVATTQAVRPESLARIALERAIASVIGLGAGVALARSGRRGAFAAFLVVGASLPLSGLANMILRMPGLAYWVFFSGGLLAALSVSIQREVFNEIDRRTGRANQYIASQWVYQALLSLSLFGVTEAIDAFGQLHAIALEFSVLTLGVTGVLGGTVVYWAARRDLHESRMA